MYVKPKLLLSKKGCLAKATCHTSNRQKLRVYENLMHISGCKDENMGFTVCNGNIIKTLIFIAAESGVCDAAINIVKNNIRLTISSHPRYGLSVSLPLILRHK